MVTKRDDDRRQGEYGAICLGKVGRQSFAILNFAYFSLVFRVQKGHFLQSGGQVRKMQKKSFFLQKWPIYILVQNISRGHEILIFFFEFWCTLPTPCPQRAHHCVAGGRVDVRPPEPILLLEYPIPLLPLYSLDPANVPYPCPSKSFSPMSFSPMSFSPTI